MCKFILTAIMIATSAYGQTLGTNLPNIRDYRVGAFQPWTDAMKSSRNPVRVLPNGTLDWAQTQPLPTTLNGYPVSGDWATLLSLPDPPYRVEIDGTGSAVLRGNTLYASGNPQAIRVVPDVTDPPLFRPEFLDALRGMSVIRFMDWQATNNSINREWMDRNTPAAITQNSSTSQGRPQGVAVEYMIALCNEINADAWVCVPHQATDDYIQRMAEAFRDGLEPGRRAYFEYSNEVWNSQFKQYHYAKERGRSMFQITNNNFRAAMVYHGWRVIEMSMILESTYADQDRYRVVLGAGLSQTDSWKKPLEYDYAGAQLADYIDHVAVAYYFGGYLGNSSSGTFRARAIKPGSLTVDDVLAECRWHVADRGDRVNNIRSTIRTHTNRRGEPLSLVAYEGGHHLDAINLNSTDTAHVENVFKQAIQDPRMTDIYADMFTRWSDGLFAVFQGPGIRFGQNGNFFSWEPGDARHAAMAPYLSAPQPEPTPVPQPEPTPSISVQVILDRLGDLEIKIDSIKSVTDQIAGVE